jgi:hypothetical protein
MPYKDSDTEGHRPINELEFGNLSKFPVPKCTVEPGADINVGDSQLQTDYGVKDGKEVGTDLTIAQYGFAKNDTAPGDEAKGKGSS